MVFSLVYTSAATQPMSRASLLELLTRCRERNTAAQITGILLYQDSRFLQLLEGDEAAVQQIYRTIRDDPRHHDVVNVWVTHGADRQFGEWSMAFRDLDEEPVSTPGYSDVLGATLRIGRGQQAEAVRELLALLAAQQ